MTDALIIKPDPKGPKGVRMTTASTDKLCKYSDCVHVIPAYEAWCPTHFREAQEGKIDECPECSRDKIAGQIICPDCDGNQDGHIPEWRYNPPGADTHHVYSLKTDDGKFHVGQTREFQETVGDHIYGRIPETAGRNPKFLWFTAVSTRQEIIVVKQKLRNIRNSEHAVIWETENWIGPFTKMLDELEFDHTQASISN